MFIYLEMCEIMNYTIQKPQKHRNFKPPKNLWNFNRKNKYDIINKEIFNKGENKRW